MSAQSVRGRRREPNGQLAPHARARVARLLARALDVSVRDLPDTRSSAGARPSLAPEAESALRLARAARRGRVSLHDDRESGDASATQSHVADAGWSGGVRQLARLAGGA